MVSLKNKIARAAWRPLLALLVGFVLASCGGGGGGGTTTDTTPPTASATSPANNATGIAVNAAITATFSETMRASTVTTATFTLNNGATGAVTYSGTTATFTPTSNLAYSTAYTATITTGVKDAAGNAMASNYTWTFTTGTAPDFPPGGVLPAGWTQPAGSAAPWTVVATGYADAGTYSLKSGVIGDSQSSVVSYTGTFVPGNISFAMSVSSEQNYDWLRFYIDGVKQGEWSGVVAWQTVTFPVTAGTHTVSWNYEKDSSLSAGSDAAWIDSVTNLPAGYVVQGGLTWSPNNIAPASIGLSGYPGTANWADANTFCTTTTLDGQTGWRLPTLPELSTLYTSGTMNGQGWTLSYTWSSTLDSGNGYGVYLLDGSVSGLYVTNYGYVSCVRDGGAISATATTTVQNLTVGAAMTSFSPLIASGGATPYTYSYTGTLPAGLSLNTSTGAVTGTPTSTYATSNLVFSVKDANNIVASTTSTVSFTVSADTNIVGTWPGTNGWGDSGWIVFSSDKTFYSSYRGSSLGSLLGTYSVSGNNVTGSGTTTVGNSFTLSSTVTGNTMAGTVVESGFGTWTFTLTKQ